MIYDFWTEWSHSFLNCLFSSTSWLCYPLITLLGSLVSVCVPFSSPLPWSLFSGLVLLVYLRGYVKRVWNMTMVLSIGLYEKVLRSGTPFLIPAITSPYLSCIPFPFAPIQKHLFSYLVYHSCISFPKILYFFYTNTCVLSNIPFFLTWLETY